MNSAWPLITAGLLMGAAGSLHCMTMCAGLQRMTLRGIPVVTVKAKPGTQSETQAVGQAGASARARADETRPGFLHSLRLPDARWWRFQTGRLAGYSLLGAAAGLFSQEVLSAARWQPVFESVWAGLNALLIVLGLSLLVLGREPRWLAALGYQLAARTPASAGRHTEWLRGMLWAFLPCGLLYTAVATAILAATPLGAAAVMAAFALGTNASLFLMEAGFQNLLTGKRPQLAYRLNGILLALLSGAGLAAALTGAAHPFC